MSQFTLAAVHFAWLPILPLIAVTVGAMVIMLVGPSVDDEDSASLGLIALMTVLAAFVLTLTGGDGGGGPAPRRTAAGARTRHRRRRRPA